MRVLRSACLLLGLVTATASAAPAASALHDAAVAYVRDPAGAAAAFLEAARHDGGDLNPLHALLLGDAAIRVGQPDVAREVLLAMRASTSNPGLVGFAELMLAWTALARGRMPEAFGHLDAAGTANPDFRPITDVALGVVASARHVPDGPALLAAAAARPVDPAWGEITPLLEGYARLWADDAAGAAGAFAEFAAARPDSRFADDARYAAAQAKRRAGRDAEADADLAALAGTGPRARGVPRGLIALDPRALLRAGMRRDLRLPARSLPARFADLFDGDGVLLARAALAAQRRRREATASAAAAASSEAVDRDRLSAGPGTAAPMGVPPSRPGSRPPSAQATARTPDRGASSPDASTANAHPRRATRVWPAALAVLLAAMVLRRRRARRRAA